MPGIREEVQLLEADAEALPLAAVGAPGRFRCCGAEAGGAHDGTAHF